MQSNGHATVSTCRWCGKPVMTSPDKRGPKKQFCGQECRESFRYYGKPKSDVQCSPKCVVCGNITPHKRGGIHRRYCSRACWQLAATKKDTHKRQIASRKWRLAKVCKQCGVLFDPEHPTQMYCCRKCRDQWKNEHPVGKERECRRCGKHYVPKRPVHISFCSRECSFAWKHANKQLYPATHIRYCMDCGCAIRKASKRCKSCARQYMLVQARVKHHANYKYDAAECVCHECGKRWYVEKRASTLKFCSAACAKRRLKRETGNHRKRCRKAGVQYDSSVQLGTLLEMRGTRCACCGKRTKRTRTHHERRATLGHIVPISKGGSHTWDNVQVECWKCNTMYGDRVHGQLVLW